MRGQPQMLTYSYFLPYMPSSLVDPLSPDDTHVHPIIRPLIPYHTSRTPTHHHSGGAFKDENLAAKVQQEDTKCVG